MNRKINIQRMIPFAGLVAVIVLFSVLTSGELVTVKNMKLVLEQAILVMVSSIGVLFVMTLGSLDFSQGSILGICSIIATTVSHANIPLAVFLTLGAGLLIGLLNGSMHAKLKIPSFIVTICTMFIFRGLTSYITRKKALQIPFRLYDFDELVYKLPLLLLLLLIGFYVFTYTRLGKQCRAIGSGEIASFYAGVKVDKIKIIAFGAAGLMGGVTALFNIVRVGTASANTGLLHETNILIAIVLGGTAVTGGAKTKFNSVIIGSLLLAVLANGLVLLGIDIAVQQLLKGLIFLGAVYLTVEKGSNYAVK